mmetsp:Transcript_50057/g.86085  ORF Transcript_50057/g.86085 Transcript_50057/m.86085 type:complete len:449 (-) Transcript_50057:542-1888(-)
MAKKVPLKIDNSVANTSIEDHGDGSIQSGDKKDNQSSDASSSCEKAPTYGEELKGKGSTQNNLDILAAAAKTHEESSPPEAQGGVHTHAPMPSPATFAPEHLPPFHPGLISPLSYGMKDCVISPLSPQAAAQAAAASPFQWRGNYNMMSPYHPEMGSHFHPPPPPHAFSPAMGMHHPSPMLMSPISPHPFFPPSGHVEQPGFFPPHGFPAVPKHVLDAIIKRPQAHPFPTIEIQQSPDSPKSCSKKGTQQKKKLARKASSPKMSPGAGSVRLCQSPNCNKCAQGSTKFCIAHGGGRRCTVPGCLKGARDKKFCSAHGGGKRCSHDDCSKAAVGGSKLCTAHGGGRRCATDGCEKSAQSSTLYCVKHGGGRQCSVEGCVKVSRGKTLFCASHGGGKRCSSEGCNRSAIAKGLHCKRHSNSVGSSPPQIPPTSTGMFPEGHGVAPLQKVC